MPVVPAICDQCGTVVSSGIVLGGHVSATMVGNTSGPCPSCGSIGTIPDGLYDVFGEFIRILALSSRSATSLERLASLLRSAQQQELDSEATATAIENETPEFAELATNVRDRQGWSLYQYLTILLMVIGIIIAARPSGGLTEQQVDQLFQQFVQAHPVLTPSPPATPSAVPSAAPSATPSAPPAMHPALMDRKNDPCPCGSGRRYRRCHGARGRGDA